MKNFIVLLLVLFPLLAFGQSRASVELLAGANLTARTAPVVANEKAVMGYNFGFMASSPFKRQRLHWLAGLQFSTYGQKYEQDVLRWGSQHNGNGGFDPDIPSGETVTAVALQHTYFFLEVPLGVRYYLTQGKVKLFVQPSVSPALFLTQRTDANYRYSDRPDLQKTSNGNTGNLRTMNLVAALGAGLEMPLSTNLNLQLMPQAGIQAFSTAKNNTDNSRMYAAGLRAGLKLVL